MTIRDELDAIDPSLIPLIERTDGTEDLINTLQQRFAQAYAASGNGHKAWDYSGGDTVRTIGCMKRLLSIGSTTSRYFQASMDRPAFTKAPR